MFNRNGKTRIVPWEVTKGFTGYLPLGFDSPPVDGEDPEPIDFTGCTIQCQIRNQASGQLLQQVTTGAGPAGLAGGDIALTIAHTATAAYTWAEAEYALGVIYADGTRELLVKGPVTIVRSTLEFT